MKRLLQFLILTNLNSWILFSNKSSSESDLQPIGIIEAKDFLKEIETITDLYEYLERKESSRYKKDIKKSLYRKLNEWIKLFENIRWINDDDRSEYEFVIGIINKLMINQIFDDLGLIPFRNSQKTWHFYNDLWRRKGTKSVIKQFFNHLIKWFYRFYDTEFFTFNELKFLNDDEVNWNNLYEILEKLLGIESSYFINSIPSVPFNSIDEDVLGHVYETILGLLRKDQGIYYTPRFVTHHISKKICSHLFEPLFLKIKKSSENNDPITDLKEILERFISIKILDPACGSGSFLIKVFDEIFEYYNKVVDLLQKKIQGIEKELKESGINQSNMDYWKKHNENIKPIEDLIKYLGIERTYIENDEKFFAKIMLRHIYGVDLDFRALNIAKLNLWIAIIRKNPSKFRYDKVPIDENFLLPNMTLNLRQGNSIVQLL